MTCRCARCGLVFGLRPLQCHPGLIAPRLPLCGAHRAERQRELSRLRSLRYRQRRRHAEIAPTQANPIPRRLLAPFTSH